MRRCLLLVLISFTLHGFSHAQGIKTIENTLLQKFSQIHHWKESEAPGKYDSLENANDSFRSMLLYYTSTCPATIQARFTALQKAGMTITTSGDGLCRIYSWDTETGGTLHYSINIYQYKDAHGVYARTDPPSTDGDAEKYGVYFYSNIYTLPVNGKKYYLAIKDAILSGKDCTQSIQAFSITGRRLDDSAMIIKTNEGLVSSIDVEYNFFSVADRPERPIRLIKYDTAKKIIHIPVVKEDGTVTKEFLLYKFNGKYFRYICPSR